MKQIITCLFLAFSLAMFAQTNETETTNDGPIMTFDTTAIDFGTIEKGSDPLRKLSFVNTGSAPLIISNAKGSCGCTVPTVPKEPIMPGEKSEIEVRYDTKRVGGFSKSITIFSNAKTPRKVIKIKGYINKGISLEKEKSLLMAN